MVYICMYDTNLVDYGILDAQAAREEQSFYSVLFVHIVSTLTQILRRLYDLYSLLYNASDFNHLPSARWMERTMREESSGDSILG